MSKTDWVPLDYRIHDVRSFDCGKESITTYLRRYAAKNTRLNLNRTFVLPHRKDPQQDGLKLSIAAYYTLAHQTVSRADLPVRNNFPHYPVPVILLAQLGVDKRFQGKGNGSKTLVHALRYPYAISQLPDGLPAVGVVLDVLDEPALMFYRSFDLFIPLTSNPMRLFCPMESVAELS